MSLAFIAVLLVVIAVSLAYWLKNIPTPEYPRDKVYAMFGNNELFQKQSVVIVTGATSGIGKEIAIELYCMGINVVMGVRNLSKADLVAAEMLQLCPQSMAKYDISYLDTSDFDTVITFASYIKENYPVVNGLVNNVGIHYGSIENNVLTNFSASIESKQGYDLSFATNYMGPFLLTMKLWSIVEGRIINVASGYHYQSDAKELVSRFDHLPEAGNPKSKSLMHRYHAYGNSKLAQILHAKELQRRFVSGGMTNVEAFSVCPGWVNTSILPNNAIGNVIRSFAYTAKAGKIGVMCALLDKELPPSSHVTHYKFEFTNKPWFYGLLNWVTKLRIRGPFTDLFAIILLLLQPYSYGCHSSPTSVEAQDPEIAKKLFDWTVKELFSTHYLTVQDML